MAAAAQEGGDLFGRWFVVAPPPPGQCLLSPLLLLLRSPSVTPIGTAPITRRGVRKEEKGGGGEGDGHATFVCRYDPLFFLLRREWKKEH